MRHMNTKSSILDIVEDRRYIYRIQEGAYKSVESNFRSDRDKKASLREKSSIYAC